MPPAMDRQELLRCLEAVSRGDLAPGEALLRIGEATADLGFARPDLARALRCGFPEVIYCGGKSPSEVAEIAVRITGASGRILCTRAERAHFEAVASRLPDAVHHERARLVVVDRAPAPPEGLVAVVSAGTADLPVAEEAAITASLMGARVSRIHDVGVAGLHRLAGHLDTLRAASAVVVVAGMEGALPSVIGGLIDRPVIAVPTSTGYGVSFGGVAALLGMLTSCAAGVVVVNIDNGFGAGHAAATINRGAAREPSGHDGPAHRTP